MNCASHHFLACAALPCNQNRNIRRSYLADSGEDLLYFGARTQHVFKRVFSEFSLQFEVLPLKLRNMKSPMENHFELIDLNRFIKKVVRALADSIEGMLFLAAAG